MAGSEGEQPRLLSLSDLMDEYKIEALSLLVSNLHYSRDDATREAREGKASYEDEKRIQSAIDSLGAGVTILKAIGVDVSLLAQMESLRKSLSDGVKPNPAFLSGSLMGILTGIHAALGDQMFMYIPKEDARFWNDINSFGEEFLITFPTDAIAEVIEMHNCLTVSRRAACVFHAMRVAEYGVRKLAFLLKIKLTHKGKPLPIEYATWNEIIVASKNKIADARKRSPGAKREKTLQFFSDVADLSEYMKDLWRNPWSHTRPKYCDREETIAIINRVRGFVQVIAKYEYKPAKRDALIARKRREIEEGRKKNDPRTSEPGS
ncbi:MAG TPA: hypothetical protein VG860_00350 [Terriglobia bacterium]|nr:hypothetical protein [Terriglobia bacterium]